MPDEPFSDFKKILSSLKNTFRFYEMKVPKPEFENFLQHSGYPDEYKHRFGDYYREKLLEHYISIKLLGFNGRDVLVDIAADQSYFAEYIQKAYKAKVYRQDLIYSEGITSGIVPMIGGNAANLPFHAGEISKMTLHCSIEHFEGDSDIRFLDEAERVLSPGGKVCILPLYLGEEYHFVYDPGCPGGRFPPGAKVYEKSGWGNRHCRVYSVEELKKRLVDGNGLSLGIYHVDLSEFGDGYYCYLAAVFTKGSIGDFGIRTIAKTLKNAIWRLQTWGGG